MDWTFLLLAGLFEIGFTTALKLTDSFTKLVPTVFFFAFSLVSFWFLSKAIETIPLGIAYAVWTGIGAVGTVCVGIYFFGEQLSMWKLFFITTLVASIFGIKLVG